MWVIDYEPKDPPRRVELGARIHATFGGVVQTVGWGVLLFTSAFVLVFGAASDPRALIDFAGPLEEAAGEVVDVQSTGSQVNEQYVYEYVYEFVGPDGVVRGGRSFAVGSGPSPGAPVRVEFPSGDPDRSRIQGMRTATFPPWVVLIVAVFPTVGLCFMLVGLRNGFLYARLLRHGVLAYGTLESKEPTSTKVNEQPVWKLTFAFTDGEGRTHRVSHSTHETAELEDQAQERVLYLPEDPARAAVLDGIPGYGQVSSLGGFEALDGRCYLRLILPTLVMLVYGFAAVFLFGG